MDWPSLRMSQYDKALVVSGSNGGARSVSLPELEAHEVLHTPVRTGAHDGPEVGGHQEHE
jgi:hypothetical protein